MRFELSLTCLGKAKTVTVFKFEYGNVADRLKISYNLFQKVIPISIKKHICLYEKYHVYKMYVVE